MKTPKRTTGESGASDTGRGSPWNEMSELLPLKPGEQLIANVDRHRRRFSGGRLFLRELTYAVQLDEAKDELVLPHVRLQVLHDPPSWLPPTRRRRKRRTSPIPGLTRRQYYQSRRFRDRFRTMIEILAGSRMHMKIELVQDPTDAPLTWEGRCESCGADLWVQGKWSDPLALPVFGGRAFMEDCTAPDDTILTRVIVPRKEAASRFSWFRIKKIGPRKY